MAGSLCKLSKDTENQINNLFSSDNDEYALVLKCVMKTNEIEVDYDLEDTDIEEIGSELADTLPRIIVFKTKLNVDNLTKVSVILLINFNPMNTPLNLKGTYKNTFKDLQRQYNNKVKSFELTDLSDFRLEIIHARARGLTGVMGEGIKPVKQTYGREVV